MTNWRQRTLPQTTPLFPLSGALLLPAGRLPLNIFEPRYLNMIDDALGEARLIGMIQPLESSGPMDAAPPLYDIGCAGRIVSFAETGDGRYLITLGGVRRFRVIDELSADKPYRRAEVDWNAFPIDAQADRSAAKVDREALLRATQRYLAGENIKADWDAAASASTEALIMSLAMGCPFAPNEKQALLEAPTIYDRADCLMALMEMSRAEDSGGDQHLQ
jgi:hypothetical protein